MSDIIKKIKNLPPLSQTVIKTFDLSIKDNKKPEDLIEIIKDDALMIVMLLKTANSAIFGFRNKIEDIENLIYILGIDFTISLILSNSLQNNFDVDFSPYGIDANKFRKITSLKINLLNLWIKKIDNELLKKLFLPVVLSDLGKYIISTHIIHINKTDEFYKDISSNINNISMIEKNYCDNTSLELTIKLLEHWALNENIIKYLKESNTKISHILDIINTLCNIIKPLDERFIQEALLKTKDYNLNQDQLNIAIEELFLNIKDI